MKHDKKPEAFFTIPSYWTGEPDKLITLPPQIILEDGSELEFSRPKTLGVSTGGFYKNAANKEFMVKMGAAYMAENNDDKFYSLNLATRYESLINNLAKVALEDSATPQTEVGKYSHEGFEFPCFVSSVIPDYRDISDKGFPEEQKKELRRKFHPAFVFNALVANDDIHDENLGIDGKGNPINIDYGIRPPFLFEEKKEFDGITHQIASFIGHQGTVGMQMVRRRYFGYDETTNPLEFGRDQKIKENDISYLEILSGVKNIVDHKADFLAQAQLPIDRILANDSIPETVKLKLANDFQTIASSLHQRIEYLEEKFSHDFPNISEKAEEFQNLKWRNHPKFKEIFDESRIVNKEIAARCDEKNIRDILKIIENNGDSDLENDDVKIFQTVREKVLKTNFLELAEDQQESIKKLAKDKFLLHTAVINQDLEMTKWLLNNEISDISLPYRQRNHSFQYFMTSPLTTAISIHNDAMIFDHKYHSSDKMIEFLAEKFFEKNPQALEEGYASDLKIPFPLRLSKLALERFEKIGNDLENQAATMIQARARGNEVRTAIKARDFERLDGGKESDEIAK